MRAPSLRPRRPVAAFLVVVAAAVAMLVAAALPASAHAVLESTTPAGGARLTDAPTQVTLTFDESVGTDATSLQVLGPDGKRVDTGGVRHGTGSGGGDEVVVGVRGGLASGTYVVAWHVVSADSHPVSGSYVFGIGVVPDAAAAAGVSRGGSTTVGVLDGISRTALQTGLVLFAGVLFFLLVLWPAGLARAGARRLVWAGWGLTVAGSVGLVLLQGPYGEGRPLRDVFAGGVLSSVLDARYGRLVLIRLVVLLLVVPPVRRLLRSGADRIVRAELGVAAVVVVLTVVATGHAGVGGWAWLTTIGQTFHVLGAAAWLGGLAVLGVLLLRPVTPRGDLAAVLPRWSRTAMVAVGVVVLTGTLQALREMDAWAELGAVAYGRLLLAKLWFVGVMLGFGWLGQRFVVRHYRTVVHAASDTALAAPPTSSPGPDARQLRGLRGTVAVEMAAGIAVLVVTSLLVNTVPAKNAYAPAVDRTVGAGPLRVRIVVEPTRQGPETIGVMALDAGGTAATISQVTGQLTLPSRSLGPITVPFVSTGTGQAVATDVAVPLTGNWQLAVQVRVGEFDSYPATISYRVR